MKSVTLYKSPTVHQSIREFLRQHDLKFSDEEKWSKTGFLPRWARMLICGTISTIAWVCFLAFFPNEPLNFFPMSLIFIGFVSGAFFARDLILADLTHTWKQIKKANRSEDTDVLEAMCFLQGFVYRQALLASCVDRMNHYLAHYALGLTDVYVQRLDTLEIELHARSLLEKALVQWEEDTEVATLMLIAAQFQKEGFVKVYHQTVKELCAKQGRDLAANDLYLRIQSLKNIDEKEYGLRHVSLKSADPRVLLNVITGVLVAIRGE